MDKKKYRSVRRSLFYWIFIGIVSITTFFSLIQINAVKKDKIQEELRAKEDTRNIAKSYIYGIELIYSMLEEETTKEAEDIQQAVIEEYNKKRTWEFSLDEFLDGKEYIDIDIINNRNVIIHGTNKENFDLDFNRWSIMKEGLDKIRIHGESDINGRASSIFTGEPTNFFYKATEDKKYIVEMRVNLLKYAQESHRTITMNDVFKKVLNNDFIEDIGYYDTLGVRYKILKNRDKDDLSISEEDKYYFDKAKESGEIVSVDKKINGKKVTEDYIPYRNINKKEKLSGVIKITYNFSSNNDIIIDFLVILAGGFWCIIIFTYIIVRKVSIIMKPIDNLLKGMNQVSNGNYDTKIDIKTKNEFEILGDNFNQMVEEIATNKKAVIEQRDEIHSLYEEQIAISEELEKALATNKKTYFETIEALARAIDAKDHYTKGHCHRVMKYSVAIAKEMGFLDCQLDDLKYGAILHDIGKIGIPESILNKKGKLTEEEYNIIKSHTEIGYNIVKDIDFLSKAKEIIYQHHEKIDGKGYPKGLNAKESNIFSRIVCVADSYDAMMSNRAYRKSMEVEQAIEELEKWKGVQFDPEVVDVFVRIIRNNKLRKLV